MHSFFSLYYSVITDSQYYSHFRAHALASDHLELAEKYDILESLYTEARALGKFDDDDLLLGLKDTIRLAASLNAALSSPPLEDCART